MTAKSFDAWVRAITVAGLVAFPGCASQPTAPEDLTTILPEAASRHETSPPAARDELAEGLSWIVDDAPKTRAIETPAGTSGHNPTEGGTL